MVISRARRAIAAAVMVRLDATENKPLYQRRKTADANTGSRASQVVLRHRPAESCNDADDGCTLCHPRITLTVPRPAHPLDSNRRRDPDRREGGADHLPAQCELGCANAHRNRRCLCESDGGGR